MAFNVPYYAQTAEFTCGPACVLMVMKHFNPKVKLNRALEFEVWRQCNMIGVRGADPFGLAVPLIDAGFETRLMTERKNGIIEKAWTSRLRRLYSREEIELSFYGMKENRRRALNRDLRVEYKHPEVSDIVDGIHDGAIPVALVHMGAVHQLNIPHWVVVLNANDSRIVFNDPYPPKGKRGINLPYSGFQKILDDIGTRIGMSPSILFVTKR